MAAESVRRLAKQVYADQILGGKTLPEQIKTSEWMTWLRDQEWFIRGDEQLAENFPLVIEHQLKPEGYRRRALLELVALRGEIGGGYRNVAELVLRGLAGTILTTNFDIGLSKALNDKQPHIRHVGEVNRSPNDFNEFNLYSRAQIVWLHGKAEQYTDRNLISETRTLGRGLVQLLSPLLESTPLIVIGYRGAEASIMESLLGISGGLRFRQGIYWCVRAGDPVHPGVSALAKRVGSNFQFLEIDGFDELLADLNMELSGVQRFASAVTSEAKQFDDQPVMDASWGDVDADLALATLRQYSFKLELGPLDSQQLRPLMRKLGLLVMTDQGERPSIACALLFGRGIGRQFPHTVISGTVDGKKRRVFSGNLISQYRSVLEWIDEEKINPLIKVKGRRQHETRPAYAERGLVELLVNMIVHRDYGSHEPSTIDAVPGRLVRFINPGAQLPEASARLCLDAEGTFEPIQEFSDLRNRALCDVFFGMNAMERAGTGLTDARILTEQLGGKASFAYPSGQESFVATLYQPEASAGSNTIARDVRPVGTYVLNLLPFASTPQYLVRVKIDGGWDALNKSVPLADAGTFAFEPRTGDLWTLLPVALANTIFASVARERAQIIPLAEVEADIVLRRKFSWVLRKHFERHLDGFESRGLIIETKKQGPPAKRAYFTPLKGGNRPIVYDTPSRTGVRREVVKKRGEERNVWFECEGFGYEVVRIANIWGVRIKPFYMFTGRNGVTPLPGYMRTSKATRRIKLDRNANVESDLTFWARFLSQGAQTINIGQRDVDDLLLEGMFVTVDVQEGGLHGDFSAENRRTA